MSLFGKSATTVALLDVRSSSIGAGYAVLKKGKSPTLAYTTRAPLAPHATERSDEAFARTLEVVLHTLVTEGAPVLRQLAGSGKADQVLVSFTAPWQKSHVFSTEIEPGKPFVFSQQTLEEAAKNAPALADGWTRVSQMVIATLLNGYEVENPFGKRVNRAELIMLSSSANTAMMELVSTAVRKALHQHRIDFDAFTPDVYDIFHDLYPHQRDFLVLDVGNEAMDIVLAKHGFLVSSTCIEQGLIRIADAARSGPVTSAPTSDALIDPARNTDFGTRMAEAESAWVAQIATSLGEIAKQEPLPRTVFLFAEENSRDYLKNLLDAPQLRPLWLSDESLAILPVLPGQFAPFLTEDSVNPADPPLAVLALAAGKRYAL